MRPGATPWLHPDGRVMRRLELHLTYTCPERCVFCSEQHRMERYEAFPVTWGRVATVLRTMAGRGVEAVHLTGGEPTLHPKFVEVCALAKKLGLRTSIGTIGTRLSREDFARRALPVLDEALFSLHGPTAEVHDPLVGRAGSFERVVRAIETCRGLDPDFDVFVNTVLTPTNVEQLGDTVELAEGLGARLIVVSNTTPEGGAEDRYEELAIPLERLAAVLPIAAKRARQAVVRFFGVPMCLLGESWALSNDLHWDPRVTVEWQSRPGKVAFDGIYNWDPGRKRTHVEVCERCDRRGICFGVFRAYRAKFGSAGLVATTTHSAGATLTP